MTSEARAWRKTAHDLGCTLYYASEPDSSSAVYGHAADEDAFHAARTKNPHWFVLNDARAWTAKYPLRLHHCDCKFLSRSTTHNWPKVIAEKRKSLKRWAGVERKNNPIVSLHKVYRLNQWRTSATSKSNISESPPQAVAAPPVWCRA